MKLRPRQPGGRALLRGPALASGYPAGTTTAACPDRFTFVPGQFVISTSGQNPPVENRLVAPDGVCRFTVFLKTT